MTSFGKSIFADVINLRISECDPLGFSEYSMCRVQRQASLYKTDTEEEETPEEGPSPVEVGAESVAVHPQAKSQQEPPVAETSRTDVSVDPGERVQPCQHLGF